MEYVDIVDKNDVVIDKAQKEDIYQKSLRHRIVHILIFDHKGKMVLQKRSAKCSFCPLHWSTAVGGHVQSGESCEKAALREYQEELGTKSVLEFLGKDLYYVPDGPEKFLNTYTTKFNGIFKPDPDAVEKVDSFKLDEIKNMIKSGEKFHPELLFILQKYYL